MPDTHLASRISIEPCGQSCIPHFRLEERREGPPPASEFITLQIKARSTTRSLVPEPSERIDRADGPGWLLLMLEIGEDLTLGRPPAQGILNRVELRSRVATLTEPVAREGGGCNIRRLQIFALGNAERDRMMPQYGIHFIAKPCAVPKFESHPQPTRIRVQKEGIEARRVDLEIGRKLEEY